MSYVERVYGSVSNDVLTSVDKKLIASIERLHQNNAKLLIQRNCNLYYESTNKPESCIKDAVLVEKVSEQVSTMCQGKKKDGTNCSFKSKPNSNYCGRHIKSIKN